jgi:hypothetical protein
LIKYGWNSLKYLTAQEGLYYFPFNIRLLVIYLKYNQILGQIVPAVEIRIRIRKIFSLTNFSEWIFFVRGISISLWGLIPESSGIFGILRKVIG